MDLTKILSEGGTPSGYLPLPGSSRLSSAYDSTDLILTSLFSEWDGFIRILKSPGTTADGTRRVKERFSTIHREPTSAISIGAG